MKKSGGFSLIELVIAVSLASFVLVGVASIATQMARNQVDGIRSGTVTGWSLVSYTAMAKEIEGANVLAFPINSGDTADALMICKNWSRSMNGPDRRLDTTGGSPAGAVSVIYYCLDTTTDPASFLLRRYANVGAYPAVSCPAVGTAIACNATPPGIWTETGVVGFRVERLSGAPIFTRDNSIGGVRLRYAIGRQTVTTNQPIAQFTPFDFGVVMQKQYGNVLD